MHTGSSEQGEFWSKRCKTYGESPDLEAKVRRMAALFVRSKTLPKSHVTMLELGCGNGKLLEEVRKLCSGVEFQITAVDASAEMLSVARSKRHLSNVEWVHQSIEHYLLRRAGSSTFDFVVCCNTLHNVVGDNVVGTVIKAFGALTTPGGYVLVDIRNRYNLFLHLIYRKWAKRGLPFQTYCPFEVATALRDVGFEIEVFSPVYWEHPGEALTKPSSTWLQWPYAIYLRLTRRIPFSPYVFIAARRGPCSWDPVAPQGRIAVVRRTPSKALS